MLSLWKSFIAPFSFVWNHSNVFAPARNAFGEGAHWSDRAAAALYVAFVCCMLLFMAWHLSTGFVFGMLAVMALLVGLKYAWHHLS